MKPRKIILIGTGLVGVSFLYAAMNRSIASSYGIIDINEKAVDGNVMDLEDAISASPEPYSVFKASYKDCKDADMIVITAGTPQKSDESRLAMVAQNAKIMESIASNVKKSGFKGVTVIVSNPVDVMTYVYHKVTGFDKNKVISSGTSLDTSRLIVELSKYLKVAPNSIQSFVIGEHGDSSVSVFSATTVGGVPLKYFEEKGLIKKEKYPEIHETIRKKGYNIAWSKGSTFFGIGACTANICQAVLNDSKKVMVVGAYLEGQYGIKDVYLGTPCVIGANGIEEIIELKLDAKEKTKMQKSGSILKDVIKSINY